MDSHHLLRQPDTLLLPYLQAINEADSRSRLQRLIDSHAMPIIEGILRSKLGSCRGRSDNCSNGQNAEDLEDLQSDIITQMLGRLQAFKARRADDGLCDFSSYVAVTTFHAVHKHLRKKYPLRSSLQNKIRYLLEHSKGLCLWKSDRGEWICGFVAWRDLNQACHPTGKLRQLLDDPQSFMRNGLPGENVTHNNPAALLAALFQWLGHPIILDDLVGVVASLWDIKDHPLAPPTEHDRLPSQHAMENVGTEVLGQLELHRYWNEIRQLTPRQCTALLLESHDPDGNSVIELLELKGVATLREIARSMAMPAEQLAALYNDLPLTDAQIAGHLEIHPQHVARLRMVARRRIAARVKRADEA